MAEKKIHIFTYKAKLEYNNIQMKSSIKEK